MTTRLVMLMGADGRDDDDNCYDNDDDDDDDDNADFQQKDA